MKRLFNNEKELIEGSYYYKTLLKKKGWRVVAKVLRDPLVGRIRQQWNPPDWKSQIDKMDANYLKKKIKRRKTPK